MSAYLNTETGEYPRHIGDLHLLGYKDGEDLPEGWVVVTPTQMPEVEDNQIAKEKAPQSIDGQWFQSWEIVTFTPEEIAEMQERRQALENLFNRHSEE